MSVNKVNHFNFNIISVAICLFISFFYLFSYAWYPVLGLHGLVDLSIGVFILSRVFVRNMLWQRYYFFPAYVVTGVDAFYHVILNDSGYYSLPMLIALAAVVLLVVDFYAIRCRRLCDVP